MLVIYATRFWEDIWLEESPLKSLLPRLYLISLHKDAMVKDLSPISDTDAWLLTFRRRLRPWEDIQVSSLKLKLNNFPLNPSKEDCPDWKWNTSGLFSVNSAYTTWEKQTFQLNNCLNSIWKNLGPARIDAFVWQAVLEKIATRSVLVRRNIIPSTAGSCPFCALSPETPVHLLLQCPFASNIWFAILSWWQVTWICPSSLPGLIEFWFSNPFQNLEESCWNTTLYTVLWSVWKARNDLVFKDIQHVVSG